MTVFSPVYDVNISHVIVTQMCVFALALTNLHFFPPQSDRGEAARPPVGFSEYCSLREREGDTQSVCVWRNRGMTKSSYKTQSNNTYT